MRWCTKPLRVADKHKADDEADVGVVRNWGIQR
jgi:hypothetical protein